MASYTDIMPQFRPYVQQLPVETMIGVGMQKQKMYEEGIQKIQSQIDSVAGLDVMRDVDKAYLQSKLNELGNNLRTVAAGDFSNFQLVNSVGGMIGQIGKDKVITAAVQSTAHDRKQFGYMEEERKKGTLSPSNEFNYTKNRQKYLDAGITDESGNPFTFSYSYKDFFNIDKFAKETFDAVKPDGWTYDQVYETDANGNIKKDSKGTPIYSPTMKRVIKEGRMPEKVKQTISQIFSDPRVNQQLAIDGEYDYRNYSPENLAEKIAVQKIDVMKVYNDKMVDLQLQKTLGKDVQAQIDDLKVTMDNTSSAYDQYAELAKSDPDAVRASLHKDDVRSRYSTMFGYMTTKEEVHDNPGWNANFKLMQEANQQSRWAQDFAFKKEQASAEEKRWWAKYEQDERLKGKGKGAGGGMGAPTLGDMPSGITAENVFDNDYQTLATDYNDKSNTLIWEGMFANNPVNIKEMNRLMSNGFTKEQAISKMIEGVAASNGEDVAAFKTRWSQKTLVYWNNLTPEEKDKKPSLGKLITQYNDSKLTFDVISATKNKINADIASIPGVIATKEDATKNVSPVTVDLDGKSYTLTKDDIYNFAVAGRAVIKSTVEGGERAKKEADDATYRIASRGLLPVFQEVLKDPGFSISGIGGVVSGKAKVAALGKELQKVNSVMDSKEFEAGNKIRQERIQQYYGVSPTLNVPILTGDTETDKNTMFQLRTMAGDYKSGQTMNMSPDFKDFAKHVSGDLKDYSAQAISKMGPNGVPIVEIVLYDDKSNRVGGMTIQKEEAVKRLGIDVDSLYVSPQVRALEHYIDINGGTTSKGDPRDKSTYIQNDSRLDNTFFPLLQNTNVTVKGNIIKSGGEYVPILYVSDGTTSKVRELPGNENLNVMISGLKQQVSPALIQAILIGK